MALALLIAPNMELADCGNAFDHTTAAAAKVMDALRRYESCVSASTPRDGTGDAKRDRKDDDCAAEMQALDDAHDNFADAVADAKGCR